MPLRAKVTWHGDQALTRIRRGAQRGVNKALEALRGDAVDLTPLRDGPLRGSAFVIPAGADGLGGTVGFDTVYAARQHEEHDWHHRQGQSNFLGQPVEQNAEKYGGIIAKEIRSELS